MLTVAIVLTLFAGRLVQLQGMESGYYKAQAAVEQVRVNPLPALRGTIYGSNGQPLAMTLETYTVTADPPLIQDAAKPSVARELAAPLHLSAAQVLNLLSHPSSPQWVQLATGVSTTDEAKIESFGISGITMTPNFVREYPDGSATANLVGFSNVNQKTSVITGQSGIEQEYNGLTGTTGSEQVMTNPNGVAIPLAGTEVTPAKDGESIKLTINPTLQFQAQQTCQQESPRPRRRTARSSSCSRRPAPSSPWPSGPPMTRTR